MTTLYMKTTKMNSVNFTKGFMILAQFAKEKQWVDWSGTPDTPGGVFWVIGVVRLDDKLISNLNDLGWSQDEADEHAWYYAPML
jgi:hypothetical protein